jgi:hypothetical protein
MDLLETLRVELVAISKELNVEIPPTNPSHHLDLHDCRIWYCGKEIMSSDRPLSVVFGGNEKSKIVIKLQRASEGPPVREPPIDSQSHKNMLEYYYKRQEQIRKLHEAEKDDEYVDHYLDSEWSNPKQLKNSLIGTHGIINYKF